MSTTADIVDEPEAQTTEAADGAPESPVAEAERSRHDLFRYSDWVHVGPGAQDCQLAVALRENPAAGKTEDLPACSDPDHFHAWCRLPNPFQVRDITAKAQAARARVVRMMRDQESDAYVILESELDQLRDPRVKDILAGEILEKQFVEHFDEATYQVMQIEDESADGEGDERPKLYANIEADREEYERQKGLPEEQRDETFAELERTIAAYARAHEAALEELRAPELERLKNRDVEDLIEIVRRDRIDRRADEEYLHTWNTWQVYVCTYKPRKRGTPNERAFPAINVFKYETPTEVVTALLTTFTGLEATLSRGRAEGNS